MSQQILKELNVLDKLFEDNSQMSIQKINNLQVDTLYIINFKNYTKQGKQIKKYGNKGVPVLANLQNGDLG